MKNLYSVLNRTTGNLICIALIVAALPGPGPATTISGEQLVTASEGEENNVVGTGHQMAQLSTELDRRFAERQKAKDEVSLQAAGCTSEGVAESGADRWHEYGWTGQGTKIAIFDNFNNYERMQSIGELPVNIELIDIEDEIYDSQYNPNVEGHGVGVAEIIYDMAPGAQLAFVDAETDEELGQYFRDIANTGYDVINISNNSVFGATAGDGTPFLKDDRVEGLEYASKKGVIITFSAGNDNLVHWNGAYTDSGYDGWHTFTSDPQYQPRLDVYTSSLVNRLGWRTIFSTDPLGEGDWDKSDFSLNIGQDGGIDAFYYLRWNDWNADRKENSGVDYDLYLLKWNEKINRWEDPPGISEEHKRQADSAKETPLEFVNYRITEPGDYGIAIKRYKGSGDHHLDVHSYQGPHLEFNVRERSLQDGATLSSVLGVGAYDIRPDWRDVAPYSSWGPIMGPGGTLEDPGHDQPFITGYAEVQVCSRRDPFGGTSAAAPHVAGAAALVKSAFPSYGAQQIRDHLSANAIDEGRTGYDHVYGYGRLHLGTPPAPDLSITKTAYPNPAAAGAQLTYTLNVQNNGSREARDVMVTDILPAGVTYVSAASSQGSCSETVSCDLDTLAPGAAATVTIVASVQPSMRVGEILTNTAEVSSDGIDADLANNTASVTTIVSAPPPAVARAANLKLTLEVNQHHVRPGQDVVFLMTVENRGRATARDVAFRKHIPDPFIPVGFYCVPPAVLQEDRYCYVDALAPGQTVTGLAVLTPEMNPTIEGLQFLTYAYVESSTPDASETNNTDQVEIFIVDPDRADLVPVLSPEGHEEYCVQAAPGEYGVVFTVLNQGSQDARATVAAVEFLMESGIVAVDVPIPAIAAGASISSGPISTPPGCFATRDCAFIITLDVTGRVSEKLENNNSAKGLCEA